MSQGRRQLGADLLKKKRSLVNVFGRRNPPSGCGVSLRCVVAGHPPGPIPRSGLRRALSGERKRAPWDGTSAETVWKSWYTVGRALGGDNIPPPIDWGMIRGKRSMWNLKESVGSVFNAGGMGNMSTQVYCSSQLGAIRQQS